MKIDRLKHSYGVAKKMQEIGSNIGYNKKELDELFVLGLNHDIGYEFVNDGVEHNKVGGTILRNCGYKYWREVYYHGEVQKEYSSMFLDILNSADMQVDIFGNDVGYEKRLDDIRNRYGDSSNVYCRCRKLVNNINEKNK